MNIIFHTFWIHKSVPLYVIVLWNALFNEQVFTFTSYNSVCKSVSSVYSYPSMQIEIIILGQLSGT